MATIEMPPKIGRRLTGARLRRGMSQGAVARLAGIAPSYLSRIEHGKIQPTLPTLLRVMQALHAQFDEIVGPEPEPGGRRGACPVSARGECLLDLIRPDGEVEPGASEAYSPREIRLLRRMARWLKASSGDRVRAMEILLEDLVRGAGRE